MRMTETRARSWSFECLVEWLKIREKEGKSFPADLPSFISEVDHSGLLQRLVTGGRALPTPPPLSLGYPWYELVDKGSAAPYEVLVGDKSINTTFGYRAIVINQHPWKIVDQAGEQDFSVTYDGKSTYRLWMANPNATNDSSINRPWMLQKMEPTTNPASSQR